MLADKSKIIIYSMEALRQLLLDFLTNFFGWQFMKRSINIIKIPNSLRLKPLVIIFPVMFKENISSQNVISSP